MSDIARHLVSSSSGGLCCQFRKRNASGSQEIPDSSCMGIGSNPAGRPGTCTDGC